MNLPAHGVERLADRLGRPEKHIRVCGPEGLLEPEIQDCGSAGTSTLSAPRPGLSRRHFWFLSPVVMIEKRWSFLGGGESRKGDTGNRGTTGWCSESQPRSGTVGGGTSGPGLQGMGMRMEAGLSVRSPQDHRRSLRSVKRDGVVTRQSSQPPDWSLERAWENIRARWGSRDIFAAQSGGIMFCPRNFALRKSVMGRLFPTWVVLILGAVLPSQCVRAQGAREEPVAERKRGQPARAVVVEVAPAQGGEVLPVPVLPAPVVELEGAVEAIVVGGGVIDGRDGPMVQVIQREALPAGVEVQIQLEGGAEARPVPPDPDAEVRKQTAEKLRQRVDVRINNKSLQGALDELAEAHGFKYRFDEASLEQAGVQPEKALVGLNVRRQPLVAVLREILQGHGLQFGLDGAQLVIVAQPKLPEGVRRKKPRTRSSRTSWP